MNNFDYVRPSSVAAAAQALSAPDATALAGGQTLIPTLKQRLAKPSMLVDLGGIAELKGIRREGSTLVIGATTTHAEVASSQEVRQSHPGARQARRRHRRCPGPPSRHHRRLGREQRSSRRLSRRGAGAWRDHRHQQAPDRGG